MVVEKVTGLIGRLQPWKRRRVLDYFFGLDDPDRFLLRQPSPCYPFIHRSNPGSGDAEAGFHFRLVGSGEHAKSV